jgi:hypothetical protein
MVMPATGELDYWYSGVQLMPVYGKYFLWCIISIDYGTGGNGTGCCHDPENDLELHSVPASG